MQTEINKLLSSISPEKVIVPTFNRANEAINTFHPKTVLIENWDEFRGSLAEFMRHLERHSLRLRGPIDISSDYYWPQCARVLLKVYGPSGEKAAFEIVRTGTEGGLNAVLRAVAMSVAEGYAKAEIQARINAYLKNLTVDQRLAASCDYLATHGNPLPSEMTVSTAARIHANFGKVLAKHPWLLLKLNEVGR